MPSATPVRTFMRSAARYLSEPHPFNRLPVTQATHSVPFAPYSQHVSRSAVLVLPAFAGFLGWPFAAKAYLNRAGLWLVEAVLTAVDGLGRSDTNISNAWEITSMDNLADLERERRREKEMAEDAREVVDVLMGMEWD